MATSHNMTMGTPIEGPWLGGQATHTNGLEGLWSPLRGSKTIKNPDSPHSLEQLSPSLYGVKNAAHAIFI
jgi:hypothetical protein